MKLYTITTIDTHERFKPWHAAVLCVCTSVESAKEIIETNTFDISEGATNDYVVIAEIESDEPYGLGDMDFPEIWYEWKGSWRDGQYEPCEKPELFRQIVFGI